jgi:hypothetical protein
MPRSIRSSLLCVVLLSGVSVGCGSSTAETEQSRAAAISEIEAAIAEIEKNPKLTPSQKRGMIERLRLEAEQQ